MHGSRVCSLPRFQVWRRSTRYHDRWRLSGRLLTASRGPPLRVHAVQWRATPERWWPAGAARPHRTWPAGAPPPHALSTPSPPSPPGPPQTSLPTACSPLDHSTSTLVAPVVMAQPSPCSRSTSAAPSRAPSPCPSPSSTPEAPPTCSLICSARWFAPLSSRSSSTSSVRSASSSPGSCPSPPTPSCSSSLAACSAWRSRLASLRVVGLCWWYVIYRWICDVEFWCGHTGASSGAELPFLVDEPVYVWSAGTTGAKRTWQVTLGECRVCERVVWNFFWRNAYSWPLRVVDIQLVLVRERRCSYEFARRIVGVMLRNKLFVDYGPTEGVFPHPALLDLP